MGVVTEADEKLKVAREAIRTALEALYAIVINRCCGADEYNEKLTAAMESALDELIKMHKALK